MDIQKLIHFCLAKLVDKPEAIVITKKEEAGKSIYEIKVAQSDLARVIGKEGKTFKAIRALVTLTDPEHVQDITVEALS